MTNPLGDLIARRVGAQFGFGEFSISRAQTEEEAAEAYALRYRVFVEEGFLEPASYPDGLFRDRFDEVSTHILVRDPDGQLVATTRFVRPSSLGFPTEHLFDFDAPPIARSKLGEYGRLAIMREHRGGARAPMLGMLKAVFECMLEEGTTHVYAFLSPELADSYAAIGCVSVPLAVKPPREITLRSRRPMRLYFERQKVVPVLFDLEQMLREVGVFSSWPRFRGSETTKAVGVAPQTNPPSSMALVNSAT